MGKDNQENIFGFDGEQDTPGEAASASGNDKEMSIESVFMVPGENDEDMDDAEHDKDEKAKSKKKDGDGVSDDDNDNVRYQYWQSEADRRANRIRELEELLVKREAQQQQPAPEQQPAKEEFDFPEPPQKPKKPSGFNREEAFSDPSSASAKYLDAMDDYQDELLQHTDMRTQYNELRLQGLQEELMEREEKLKHELARDRKIASARDNLVAEHGLTPQMANEFIERYSDPGSVTMENLVKLYMLDKGATYRGATPQKSPSPSPDFRQTSNAQRVAPPMGVLPSQRRKTESDVGSSFMDSIISYDRQQNPFDTVK